MRNTTIRDNGKDIPFAEWLTRKAKALRIKKELADTPEKRAAVDKEIRRTRHFMDFVKGNISTGRDIEYLTIEKRGENCYE